MTAGGTNLTGDRLAFRERVCAGWGCAASEYEMFVLKRTLYPFAQILYPLITTLRANFFEPDLQIIRQIARCTAMRDLHAEYASHRQDLRFSQNLFRRMLSLRISGRRLMDFASAVFSRKLEK